MYFKCSKKEFNQEVANAFSNNYELLGNDCIFNYYHIITSNTDFYYNKDLLVYRDISNNTYKFYYYNKFKLVPLVLKAKQYLQKKSKKKS